MGERRHDTILCTLAPNVLVLLLHTMADSMCKAVSAMPPEILANLDPASMARLVEVREVLNEIMEQEDSAADIALRNAGASLRMRLARQEKPRPEGDADA